MKLIQLTNDNAKWFLVFVVYQGRHPYLNMEASAEEAPTITHHRQSMEWVNTIRKGNAVIFPSDEHLLVINGTSNDSHNNKVK